MRGAPYWILTVVVAVVLLPVVTFALFAVMAGVAGEMLIDYSGKVIERVERIGTKRSGT